jgi:hypothetical protein
MSRADELLIEILETKGVEYDSEGHLVPIPGRTGSSFSEQQLRYVNERRDDHAIETQLRLSWIQQLKEAANEISRNECGADWPWRCALWIRLHGVLDDERRRFRQFFQTLQIDPAAVRLGPGTDTALAHAKRMFDGIETLRKLFTDDELVYAEYLRHTNGHPVQAVYSLRWSTKANDVADKHRVATLEPSRELTTGELRAAIRRVLDANKFEGRVNEHWIAVVYARRMATQVGVLLEEMHVGATPDAR